LVEISNEGSSVQTGDSKTTLEDFETHLVIRAVEFDGDAALQTRTDTGIERFQLPGRAVGRNHDLLGAVEQHIQEMAELVLDHLALQELHVVDDQEVDVAQESFKRQGVIVADRSRETPHEVFRRQIDDAGARVVLHGRIGNCLQQMRLAETDGRMNEERIEAHCAWPASAIVFAAASATRLEEPSTNVSNV
jgi:hypothetical protein